VKRSNVIVGIGLTLLLFVVAPAVDVTAQDAMQRRIDSLFVLASSGSVTHKDMVEPAQDSIAALGAAAVPYMVAKYTTKSAREKWAVTFILRKIGAAGVPSLVSSLRTADSLTIGRICDVLGDIKDTGAVMALIDMQDHSRWQVRDAAVGSLGKIGDLRAVETVMTRLVDTIGQVRKAASVSAGKLVLADAAEELVHMLGDEFYGARMSALASLQTLDTSLVLSILADSINSANHLVGDLACKFLGDTGGDHSMALLLTQITSDNPDRRAHAAVALVKADPWDNCGYRHFYYNVEPDRLVRLKIESAIRAAQDEQTES